MKLFTYILSLIAVILLVYNLTKVDFINPFGDDSIVAIITVFASLCVILILAILRISKRIEKLQKRKS